MANSLIPLPLLSRVMESTDIRIVNNVSLDGIWTDWLYSNGNLDESEVLGNLVIVALLTDRWSLDSDILPDPDDSDRRGWWGDFEAPIIWDGWDIGCRNWVFARSKIVGAAAQEGSTLIRIEQSCREALQPLVDRRICTAFTVDVERIDTQRIDATIVIYRGPKREIELRFQDLWAEIREA